MADLEPAIASLYDVFAGYEPRDLAPTESCGSADDPALQGVRSAILAKPLTALRGEDLLDYYYLAVDHIGNADDLRHFLPRILELIASPHGELLAPEQLPHLLASADAAHWPPAERAAMARFVAAMAAAHLLSSDIASQLREIVG